MKHPVPRLWFGLAALTLLITALEVRVQWNRPELNPLKGTPSARIETAPSSTLPQPPGAGLLPAASRALTAATPPFFSKEGKVQGRPALDFPTQINPQTLKGRTVTLKAAAMMQWKQLQAGSPVTLPSFDEDSYEGTIALRLEDRGWLRFGGTLSQGRGTFSLHLQNGQIAGTIFLLGRGLGLELRTEPTGEVVLVERPLEHFLCWPGLPADSGIAAAPSDGNAASSSNEGVPQMNTRPGAKGLIYLHFSGGTVTDPSWNGGLPIEAAPSGLSADGIREVVARVAEDYAPFDMAVSTIASDYDNSSPGRRMRVIVTPTNRLLPGAGGISLIGSWSSSGKIRSSTVPAWVFTATPKTIAEAASHEVGHTLGLSHDGTLNPPYRTYENGQETYHPSGLASPYYSGNGPEGSPTSWAPIMGNSYSRPLTQWSKGEYQNANNTEDDIAIIASSSNGVSYALNLQALDTDVSGPYRLLNIEAGTFCATGILTRTGLPDLPQSDSPEHFHFATTGGSLSVTATPLSPNFTNVDLQLELYKLDPSTGEFSLLSKANPPDLLGSVLQAQDLPKGTYQIAVRPAASAETDTGIYITGYSSYGSLGPYQISGTVENAESAPAFLSPVLLKGCVGTELDLPLTFTDSTSVTGTPSPLPPGVTWNQETQRLQGTPTKPGVYNITFVLKSTAGTLPRSLKLWLDYPGIPVPVIDGALGAFLNNSPAAPWTGQLLPLEDGTSVRAAVSGHVANGGSSRLRLRVPAKRTVSFWWKTSSEAGHDGLECRLNGALARDTATGKPLRISGETRWSRQKIRVDGNTAGTIEFSYSKDGTLSEGQDRGWIYGIEVGVQPVIKKSPSSVRLKIGDSSLSLSAIAENASSFQWKKDGIPLRDEKLDGREVSGATTQNLTITGISGADSGGYTLEAKNVFDTIASRKADVVVPAAPIILQTTSPTAPVKAGEALLLGVEAAGAKAFTSSWKKNGALIRRVGGTLLQIKNASPTMSGTYTVTVTNSFGTSPPKELKVEVLPAP
ncbi:MAG: Immunoglobulin domain-containing protein [Verrucomicrobia bacterium]|nr:MAG: Immunoglobulin domain-containing protein [Verrucomicrobiota bacterium]